MFLTLFCVAAVLVPVCVAQSSTSPFHNTSTSTINPTGKAYCACGYSYLDYDYLWYDEILTETVTVYHTIGVNNATIGTRLATAAATYTQQLGSFAERDDAIVPRGIETITINGLSDDAMLSQTKVFSMGHYRYSTLSSITISGTTMTTCTSVTLSSAVPPGPTNFSYSYQTSIGFNHSSGGFGGFIPIITGIQSMDQYVADAVGATKCSGQESRLGGGGQMTASMKMPVTVLTITSNVYPTDVVQMSSNPKEEASSAEEPGAQGGIIMVTSSESLSVSPTQRAIVKITTTEPPITAVNTAIPPPPPTTSISISASISTTQPGLGGIIISFLDGDTNTSPPTITTQKQTTTTIPIEYITLGTSTLPVLHHTTTLPSQTSAVQEVVIAGQTLTQGGYITVLGQTLSLAAGGTGIVVGTKTEGFRTTSVVGVVVSGNVIVPTTFPRVGDVVKTITGTDGKVGVTTILGGGREGGETVSAIAVVKTTPGANGKVAVTPVLSTQSFAKVVKTTTGADGRVGVTTLIAEVTGGGGSGGSGNLVTKTAVGTNGVTRTFVVGGGAENTGTSTSTSILPVQFLGSGKRWCVDASILGAVMVMGGLVLL